MIVDTQSMKRVSLQTLRNVRNALGSVEWQRNRHLDDRRIWIMQAHNAGAGLGEIAAAAGITPQRVSQIILKGETR